LQSRCSIALANTVRTAFDAGQPCWGASANDPAVVAKLAIGERSEEVVRFVAECGRHFEPHNPYWVNLLERLPARDLPKGGVLPHPTRFVAMNG
jgi:hypothetical protein